MFRKVCFPLQKYGKEMVGVSGPLFWNSVPKNIHDSASLAAFKASVKTLHKSKLVVFHVLSTLSVLNGAINR